MQVWPCCCGTWFAFPGGLEADCLSPVDPPDTLPAVPCGAENSKCSRVRAFSWFSHLSGVARQGDCGPYLTAEAIEHSGDSRLIFDMGVQWTHIYLNEGWTIFAAYIPQMESDDYNDLVLAPFLEDLRERHWEYVEWHHREIEAPWFDSEDSQDEPE